MRERRRERRSRDRKANKEGRVLVSGLEEAGWYIFNEKRMRREIRHTQGEGGNPYLTM